ncbi:MAG: VWA domain-containing protein [Candidatus Coatesbacteria bacterium]|nr:VWA domain-containing protein [Candidatus Coatesbacteria bacterium]
MGQARCGSSAHRALFLAFIFLFFASSFGYSETSFPPGLKPAVLKIVNLDISQYPTVSCELLLRDYSGNKIPLNGDLTLRLLEDEIPITDFTVETSRMVATILLLDTSGSMLGKMDKVADGVGAYLDLLGPDDRVMLMEFNSWRGYTPVVQDFTNDTELIQNQILKLQPRGQTAVYDAIADASDYFFPKYREASKVIIVLSDGEDNNSVREWFTAIRFAAEHNIRIFFIALGPEADRRTFSQISRETEGETFIAPTTESLPAAYKNISQNIRAKQTILTYTTDEDTTADGRPHYIQVAVYKGATKWVESPLKSFKFRILKTAEQLAADEKAKQERLEAAATSLETAAGASTEATTAVGTPAEEKAPEEEHEAKPSEEKTEGE